MHILSSKVVSFWIFNPILGLSIVDNPCVKQLWVILFSSIISELNNVTQLLKVNFLWLKGSIILKNFSILSSTLFWQYGIAFIISINCSSFSTPSPSLSNLLNKFKKFFKYFSLFCIWFSHTIWIKSLYGTFASNFNLFIFDKSSLVTFFLSVKNTSVKSYSNTFTKNDKTINNINIIYNQNYIFKNINEKLNDELTYIKIN